MSHRPLIDRWPNIRAFAEDLGVKYETAKGIRRRGWIPDRYYEKAVTGARKRSFHEVTHERLSQLADKRIRGQTHDAASAMGEAA